MYISSNANALILLLVARAATMCMLAIWNIFNLFNDFFTIVFERMAASSTEFAGKQCKHVSITIIIGGFKRENPCTL